MSEKPAATAVGSINSTSFNTQTIKKVFVMSIATNAVRPVLVAGQWRDAAHRETFQATDPATNQTLPAEFPVSAWEDCDAALDAALEAFEQLRRTPADTIATFLERYADRIEADKDSLVETASKYAQSLKWDVETINEAETTLYRVVDESDVDYVGPTKGLLIHPHPNSEPLRLEFDKDLVIQYSVKHEQKLDCGGAYLKLMPGGKKFDASKFGGDTPYAVMFGPDICGSSNKKTHVILHSNVKDDNLLVNKEVSTETDDLTHLYTLVVKPDNTFEVLIDNKSVREGKLEDEFDFMEPKQIKEFANSLAKKFFARPGNSASCSNQASSQQPRYAWPSGTRLQFRSGRDSRIWRGRWSDRLDRDRILQSK